MAQLVVAVAGAALGAATFGAAPLIFGLGGGSLGWMAGSIVGGLLASSMQHSDGPRLGDLKVTGLQYGQPIPWIRGAPRTTGQLVWASDKRELSQTQSQGKGGGPKVTTYTYEIDMLYLLSDDECDAITRLLWNGKLIWTNLASATDESRVASLANDYFRRLTFYRGNSVQLPDPTYEAAVGADLAPGYRGRACIFLEGVQLGSSGQLPNLTFEVCSAADGSTDFSRRKNVTLTDVTYYTSDPSENYPAIVAMKPKVRVAIIDRITDAHPIYEYGIDGEYIRQDVRKARENYPGKPGYGGNETHPVGLLNGQPVRLSVGNGLIENIGGAIKKLPIGWRDDDAIGVGFAYDLASPLPASEFIGSVALCSDGQHYLVFTAPRSVYFGASEIDKWYILKYNGVSSFILKHGAVEPKAVMLSFGFGNVATYHFSACMLEDDLQHVWVCYAAGDGLVKMYGIGRDGVLGLRSTISAPNGIPRADTLHPTIWAENNYCVVIAGNYFCAFSRIGEVIGNVPLVDVVSDLCLRAGMGAADIDVTGLASITKPVRALAVSQVGATRSTLEQLQAGYFFDCVLSDKLYFRPRASASVLTIPYSDLGAGQGQASNQPFELTIASDLELPAQVAVQYANMSNDQQTGTERSDRMISGQASLQTVQLALGFTPAEAKGIADAMVADGLAALVTVPISLPVAYSALEASDVVQVQDGKGLTHRLRLTKKNDQGGVLQFDAVRDDAAVVVSSQITDTHYTPAADVASVADTVFLPLDIPLQRDGDDGAGYYVVAKGSGGRWPGASILTSSNDTDFSTAAQVGESAVFGQCTTTLGAWAGGWVMDEANNLTVNMGAGELESVTRDALLAGGAINALMVGAEMILFMVATLQSANPNIYKITRLLRGQRGTEWAMNSHGATENAVLLRPAGMRHVTQQAGDVGQSRYLRGVTAGKTVASATSITFANGGVSQKPLAPVDLRMARTGTDDLVISWKRRTRMSTALCGVQGISVPLGEASEAYVVQILAGSNPLRTLQATAQAVGYTRSQLVSDFGYTPQVIGIRVWQVSAAVGAGYVLTQQVEVPASISAAVAPGEPPAPAPAPPASTETKAVTNLVAATATGVLAMRVEYPVSPNALPVPVYYKSSGAAMVATGLSSTAFCSFGTNHTYLSFKLGATCWYVADGGAYGGGGFAISFPTDFSTAPVRYSSGFDTTVPGDIPSTPTMIGCDGTNVVAWKGGHIWTTTSFPTWTYVGHATPDPGEVYNTAYQYFPLIIAQPRKLLWTGSTWFILSVSLAWRTADPAALTGWKFCSQISSDRYDLYTQTQQFYNAFVDGGRLYLCGLDISNPVEHRPFIAISADGGATWVKSNIGPPDYSYESIYHHFMKVGSNVVAIRADGAKVAINDGSGTTWVEYATTGLGPVPTYNATEPKGQFFIDTRYARTGPGGGSYNDNWFIVHTTDGINWSPVA